MRARTLFAAGTAEEGEAAGIWNHARAAAMRGARKTKRNGPGSTFWKAKANKKEGKNNGQNKKEDRLNKDPGELQDLGEGKNQDGAGENHKDAHKNSEDKLVNNGREEEME